MKVIMKTPCKHGGKVVPPGSPITLDDKEAAGWIAGGLAHAVDEATASPYVDREALFARAEALGLNLRKNTATDKLIAAIEEAEIGGD